MAVTFNRVGANLTVTITDDVKDLNDGTLTKKEKIQTILRRGIAQLASHIEAQDASEFDKEIARLTAAKAALPPPIGAF